MILVDTSVWIDHLRRPQPTLSHYLEKGEVVCHQFVIEELACGWLRERSKVLAELTTLPRAPVVSHEEFLHFVESHKLAGSGLGPVDVHLLASARLENAQLLSSDVALARAAAQLGIATA